MLNRFEYRIKQIIFEEILQIIKKDVNPEDVIRHSQRLDSSGKHQKILNKEWYATLISNSLHYLIQVSISDLDYLESDNQLIYQYSMLDTEFPPIYVKYGKRSAKRKKQKLFVSNGNHRVNAAVLRGDSKILAYISKDDYLRYIKEIKQ